MEGCAFVCVCVCFVHSQQAELKVRVKTINEPLSAHQYGIDVVHIHLQEQRTDHSIASNVTVLQTIGLIPEKTEKHNHAQVSHISCLPATKEHLTALNHLLK